MKCHCLHVCHFAAVTHVMLMCSQTEQYALMYIVYILYACVSSERHVHVLQPMSSCMLCIQQMPVEADAEPRY